jgi:hypothetical protein
MLITTRRALPVLALLLTFLDLNARPAHAQTATAPQIQPLLNIRLMQANALNGLIQQLSAFPTAQVPNSSVQSTIALYQGALANVQYQINQLQVLNALLNQASAIYSLIQNPQNQANLPVLQYALSTVQAQISNVQGTITVP